MMQLFDRYSFKAIYLPTVIVLASPIINVYLLIALNALNINEIAISMKTPPKIVTSIIPILLYLIALTLVRTSGRKKQQKLLEQWGGFPTMRFLRNGDNRFSEEMKKNLKDTIKNRFNMTLLAPQEETKRPQEADKRISDAFVLVKDWLRKNDKEAFWQKHNIDYGFYRNLWGSSWLWTGFNLTFLVISIVQYWVLNSAVFLYLIFFNIIINIVSLMIIIFYLPKATRFSAEQYAESAWSAFYNLGRQ